MARKLAPGSLLTTEDQKKLYAETMGALGDLGIPARIGAPTLGGRRQTDEQARPLARLREVEAVDGRGASAVTTVLIVVLIVVLLIAFVLASRRR